MSDARAHRNLKNEIRRALGGMPDVWCANNESGYDPTHRVRYGIGDGGADLLCIIAPHGHALWLEVKTGRARQARNQKLFEGLVKRYGSSYAVVRSVDDAIAAVADAKAVYSTAAEGAK